MPDNDPITVMGQHVICIIDVLGQRSRLRKWPDLNEGEPSAELIAAVKATAGTVLGFGEQFETFFKAMSGGPPAGITPRTKSKEDQARFERFTECQIRTERFSDTFLFHSQVVNSHGDVSIIPLHTCVCACCSEMLVSLAAGCPIRGGLAIGVGAKLWDDRFYGPGMVEAHQLESEVAGSPRIVCSEGIREFLSFRPYSKDAKVANAMNKIAAQCSSLLCEDVDGHIIVDFLGEGCHQMLGADTNTKTDLAQRVHSFVCSEAQRFRHAGNAKLSSRYHLLKHYVEQRLDIWGVKPTVS